MDRPLLSLRSALVFLLALLTGAGASGLTIFTGEGAVRSLLAGLTATGPVQFFNYLIAGEGGSVQPPCSVRAGMPEEESNG